MVNNVLKAITVQLHSTFGDSYKYYVENVEQNLAKPCFTVDTIIPLQRSKSPVLYDRTFPMVIHYFTGDKKDTKMDCYAKAEQLVECLEYLPFESTTLRCENISWQIVDDVLQVFVTYKFTTAKIIDIDNMATLEETQVSHT